MTIKTRRTEYEISTSPYWAVSLLRPTWWPTRLRFWLHVGWFVLVGWRR